MPTDLDIVFKEKATGVINAAFTDEDGATVVPTACTYTLTDNSGNIINNINQTAASLASSVDIVLTGDDLAIQTTEVSEAQVLRRLLVEFEYTSSLGSGLPGKQSGSFLIENLLAVS